MVRRDPDTGKFVSGGSAKAVQWNDVKTIHGVNHYNIPAADLSGGTYERSVDGSNSEIINFSGELANDEVFRALGLQYVATLGGPTTATAEGSMELSWMVSSKPEQSSMRANSPFYGGNVNREQGTIDIVNGYQETTGTLVYGEMHAEPSAADSTNGLGLGADYDRERGIISFVEMFGDGPAYDRDDELYAPAEFGIDNVSDHAVNATIGVLLHGTVEELD